MNRPSAAVAALVLGAAIAVPMLAWSADPPPPPDQAAPGGPPPPAPGPMHGPGMMGMHGPEMREGGMGWREGRGGEGWHHRMFGMMRLSPKQRCEEKLARRAGIIAYTIAKLNLQANQRQLWDKVQAPLQDAGNKMRDLCDTLPSGEQRRDESTLDRMNRRIQFLSARLQALQQTQAPMQQFYQSLTPDQKAIMDHPFRRD